MMEVTLIIAIAVSMCVVYYLQIAHARDRFRTTQEFTKVSVESMQQTQHLAFEMLANNAKQQAEFMTESLGSMRAMYNAYMQHALRAATMAKAQSASEGAMAAGTLAQTDGALDPELQEKMLAIQSKLGEHTPWQRPQQVDPAAAIHAAPPGVIQDVSTGDVLVRM